MKAASKGGMLYLQHGRSNDENKSIKTSEKNNKVSDIESLTISTDGHASIGDKHIKLDESKISSLIKYKSSIMKKLKIETDGDLIIENGHIKIDGSNIRIKHKSLNLLKAKKIYITANRVNDPRKENSTSIPNKLLNNASPQIVNLTEMLARIKAQKLRKEVLLIIEKNKRTIATKQNEIKEQLLILDKKYHKLNSDISVQRNIQKKQYLYKFILLQAQKIKLKFLEFCNLIVMKENEINSKLVASHGYLDILKSLGLSSHSTSTTLLDELEEFLLFLPKIYQEIFVENIEIFKKEISILQALEEEFNSVNQSRQETFFDYKSDSFYKEILQPIKSKHSTANLPDEFIIPSTSLSYDNSKNLFAILNIILSYQVFKLSLKSALKECDNMCIANFLYEDIKQQQIDALQESLETRAEIALATLQNEYDQKISALNLIDINNQLDYEIIIEKLIQHDLSVERIFNHEIFKLKLEIIKSGTLNKEQYDKILDFEHKFDHLLERSKSVKNMLNLKIELLSSNNNFFMKNNTDEARSNSI